MTFIERLVPRHDVGLGVVHVLHGDRRCILERWKIIPGRNRLDAGQRFGSTGVDAAYHGVRMRATENQADEHSGRLQIGAVTCASGHLVSAIGSGRPGADHIESGLSAFISVLAHRHPPVSSRH